MELPLFPLHTVLFPGRPLPLHLFEPRYRRMLADCMDADRRFGVVAIRAGREVGNSAEIYGVGTVAEIQTVDELPDGRWDIVTRGVQRFRVRRLLEGAPYLRAAVELLEDAPCLASREDMAVAERLRALLIPYLAGLGAPDELLSCLPSDPDRLAYLAAAAVQVEVPQHQRLLELDTTAKRVAATLHMLHREMSLMRHLGTVGSLRPAAPVGYDLN